MKATPNNLQPNNLNLVHSEIGLLVVNQTHVFVFVWWKYIVEYGDASWWGCIVMILIKNNKCICMILFVFFISSAVYICFVFWDWSWGSMQMMIIWNIVRNNWLIYIYWVPVYAYVFRVSVFVCIDVTMII